MESAPHFPRAETEFSTILQAQTTYTFVPTNFIGVLVIYLLYSILSNDFIVFGNIFVIFEGLTILPILCIPENELDGFVDVQQLSLSPDTQWLRKTILGSRQGKQYCCTEFQYH